ncbi:hypothetical protein [Actinocrispum sp. NPDC049592]|uniref:hypothetical protein n=1 Tax=Actinocrispum sp. NPDC049592 TaxID=3154835 RepID=UPI003430F60B
MTDENQPGPEPTDAPLPVGQWSANPAEAGHSAVSNNPATPTHSGEPPQQTTPDLPLTAAYSSEPPQPGTPDVLLTVPYSNEPSQQTTPGVPFTVPYSSEPLPGQQFPAAVLPQTEFGQQPPSQPFPAIPQVQPFPTTPQSQPFPAQPTTPQSQPFPAQQPFPAPPRKPRSKALVALSVAAAFFFLASAALGTLWLIEIGDHKSTANELHTTQASLTKAKDDLKSAEGREQAANTERQKSLKDVQNMQPCYNAAKAFMRANSEQEADKLFDQLIDAC